MRTTVSIDDELLKSAKRRAAERGKTLGQVLEDALRRELAAPAPAERPIVPVFRGGSGPRPGIDLTSNRALHEALDEGVDPLERR
jgi:hypothetical protein